MALKTNGTVVEWGSMGAEPTEVPGLSNVVAIAAGGVHSVALKADGTVVNLSREQAGETFQGAVVGLGGLGHGQVVLLLDEARLQRRGQVARVALLGRHRDNFAACFEESARAGGREG